MHKHTPHADLTKTAIGYVRVSTQEQATEGVSLDTQRDKLRSYCKSNGIRLVDVVSDEGISGSTLDRPGLQAALRMIRRGRANTLIVAKLDRLSRSLRDVCALVGDYFTDERYHLLSCCGMVNTHSAAGRMLMMNLANFSEFERAMISERTRETLQHMKAQGIRLGPAPYGYQLSNQLDDKGRRVLVPRASRLAGETVVPNATPPPGCNQLAHQSARNTLNTLSTQRTMSPGEAAALRSLRATDYFGVGHVGANGATVPAWYGMQTLLRRPALARPLFKQLLADSRVEPAGKLYALCGLRALDDPEVSRYAATLAHDQNALRFRPGGCRGVIT